MIAIKASVSLKVRSEICQDVLFSTNAAYTLPIRIACRKRMKVQSQHFNGARNPTKWGLQAQPF